MNLFGSNHANVVVLKVLCYSTSTSQKWWCLFRIKHTLLWLFDAFASYVAAEIAEPLPLTDFLICTHRVFDYWNLTSFVPWDMWKCGSAIQRMELSLSLFIFIQIILLIMCPWYAVACHYILPPVVRCFKFSVLVCFYCRRRLFDCRRERVEASCVRSARSLIWIQP